MVVQTLPQSFARRKELASASPPRSHSSRAVTAKRSRASELERVEDDLIDRSLGAHPNHEAALDAALDDMALLSAEVRDSRRRPLLLRSTTHLNQIEDLLLEAVVRTHPNRERALDHLMADLAGELAVHDFVGHSRVG